MKIYIMVLLCFGTSVESFGVNCSQLGASLTPPSSYVREVEAPKENKLKGTREFISYLGRLFEEQIIGVEELTRLIENLESGSLLNPILKNDTSISSTSHVHYEGLQRHLDEGKFDFNELDKWVREVIKTQGRLKKSRNKVKKETQETYSKMKFFPIPQGEFEMPKDGEVKTFKIDYSFELGSTVVTQKQWVDIMGENPSFFANGPDTIAMVVDGKSVILQPDHPVEYISFWSILEFANRMSIKEGLRPVYDMSEMVFAGQAENGTLDRVEGRLKFNVAEGNLAEKGGYRLPTARERFYVASNLGQSKGNYHYGADPKVLADYAWYEANAQGSTQTVAQLKALVIGGKPFFDIHGNVMEFLTDSEGVMKIQYSGQLPYYATGGNFLQTGGFTKFQKYYSSLDSALRGVGFRLARTLAEE